MTNKIILTNLFLAFFIGLSSVNAQKLGIRLEYGLNTIAQEESYLIAPGKNVDYLLQTQDVSTSQSIGLFTSFDFGLLFFQPEIMYTTYSTTLNLEKYGEGRSNGNSIVTEKFQQVDLPIYAGVKYKNFKIGGGPVLHIGENVDSEIEDFDKISVRSNGVTAGMQVGLGVDLKYVNLDIKYQRDFNQSTDHIYYGDSQTRLNSSLSSIKIGLAFSLSK